MHSPLPDERNSIVHRFSLGDAEGILAIGFYPSGEIGEVFAWSDSIGSTTHGLLDSLCILISSELQHGVPLDKVCGKLRHQTYEPAGRTRNSVIPFASSLSDYLAQYLLELHERRKAQPKPTSDSTYYISVTEITEEQACQPEQPSKKRKSSPSSSAARPTKRTSRSTARTLSSKTTATAADS